MNNSIAYYVNVTKDTVIRMHNSTTDTGNLSATGQMHDQLSSPATYQHISVISKWNIPAQQWYTHKQLISTVVPYTKATQQHNSAISTNNLSAHHYQIHK